MVINRILQGMSGIAYRACPSGFCVRYFLSLAGVALAIMGLLVRVSFGGGEVNAERGDGLGGDKDGQRTAAARLVGAYPEYLNRIDGRMLVWRDGTRMPLDDGLTGKTFKQKLETPDILDMLELPYEPGPISKPPAENDDPGRFRPQDFFIKLYGDCRKGEVFPDLIDVVWLPKKSGLRLKVTKRNGVAERVRAISRELDALEDRYTKYLAPPGGTFNCRNIAGTSRLSAHSFGIAIDISIKYAHYWRWTKSKKPLARAYRNDIPWQIVAIFEKHGFIWGGKWSHYDTMHFEYRPELITPQQ